MNYCRLCHTLIDIFCSIGIWQFHSYSSPLEGTKITICVKLITYKEEHLFWVLPSPNLLCYLVGSSLIKFLKRVNQVPLMEVISLNYQNRLRYHQDSGCAWFIQHHHNIIYRYTHSYTDHYFWH